ncbi:diiron oxygenase [Spirillospora sp. CA-294931]|uniref:diiron oxygenase n=1 Tax=Spirillospora sp. CA-294931 TaxID=3240042 RepID=UPI003D8F4646
MSPPDPYVVGSDPAGWEVKAQGPIRFAWDYDEGRAQLLTLYRKGKEKQWDADRRIDWDLPVDRDDPLRLPPQIQPLYDTPLWRRLSHDDRAELARHGMAWQFSQFLHGEQGALLCAARIVDTVPDMDAKFYAATQVADEARHAEIYARFLKEKIGLRYPINRSLMHLLDDTLGDSRWDLPYLGMQVLVEGVALAAFGVLRDTTEEQLPEQILTYIMQDEARHVAFGRLALRDYYRNLTSAERAEREEFLIEGCRLMRDRMRGEEVFHALGLPVAEAVEAIEHSQYLRAFRRLLFNRIVPCVRDIGLWGPNVRRAFAELGVLHLVDADLDEMMDEDEEHAADMDAERQWAVEEAERTGEIMHTVARGEEVSR